MGEGRPAVSHVTFTHMVGACRRYGLRAPLWSACGNVAVGRSAAAGRTGDDRQRRCVRDGCARQTVPVTRRRVADSRRCAAAAAAAVAKAVARIRRQLVPRRPPTPPLAAAPVVGHWFRVGRK